MASAAFRAAGPAPEELTPVYRPGPADTEKEITWATQDVCVQHRSHLSSASSSLDRHPPLQVSNKFKLLSLGRSLELKLAQQDPAHAAPWTPPPRPGGGGRPGTLTQASELGRERRWGCCAPHSWAHHGWRPRAQVYEVVLCHFTQHLPGRRHAGPEGKAHKIPGFPCSHPPGMCPQPPPQSLLFHHPNISTTVRKTRGKVKSRPVSWPPGS